MCDTLTPCPCGNNEIWRPRGTPGLYMSKKAVMCTWSLIRTLRLTLHKRANGFLRPLWHGYISKVKKYFLPDTGEEILVFIYSLWMVSPSLIVDVSVKFVYQPESNRKSTSQFHLFPSHLATKKEARIVI